VTGCALAAGIVQSISVRPPSSIKRRASVRGGQRLFPVRLWTNAKAAAQSVAAMGSVAMTSGTPRRYFLNCTRNFITASSSQSFSNERLRRW
jgi:hypothetical protein